MNSEVMTKHEAAEFLKIPVRTVEYLIATNQIPFSRLGKRAVRFYRARLIEWIREREGVELRYNKSATN